MSTDTTTIDHTDHIVRLQRILHKIETDPAHWNQRVWSTLESEYRSEDLQEGVEPGCGTSFCFAGWAAALEPTVKWTGAGTVLLTDVERPIYGADQYVDGQGRVASSVARWAEHHLGLTSGEATDLFAGYNDLDQLREQVGTITRRMLDEMYPPPPPMVEWDVVIVTKDYTRVTVKAVDEAQASTLALAQTGLAESDEQVIEVVVEPHDNVPF